MKRGNERERQCGMERDMQEGGEDRAKSHMCPAGVLAGAAMMAKSLPWSIKVWYHGNNPSVSAAVKVKVSFSLLLLFLLPERGSG